MSDTATAATPAAPTFLSKLEADFEAVKEAIANHLSTVTKDAPEAAAAVEADVKAALTFLQSPGGIGLLGTIGSVVSMAGGPTAAQTWSAFTAVSAELAKLLDGLPAPATSK
jgi:hypothetical protein